MFLPVPGRVASVEESPDRTRLATVVKRRRLALRMTQKEAAALVKMSAVTWRLVETAAPVRDLTLYGVDLALGWEPGSCEAVLAGGEPTLRADQTPAETEGAAGSVGPVPQDAYAFRYQRPQHLSDAEWDALRREHAAYWDYLIDKAARERD